MAPFIRGFEDDVARFVMLNLIKPIVEYFAGEAAWRNSKIDLHWGPPARPSLAEIQSLIGTASAIPAFAERLDWQEVFGSLQDAGLEWHMKTDEELEKEKAKEKEEINEEEEANKSKRRYFDAMSQTLQDRRQSDIDSNEGEDDEADENKGMMEEDD